jgi:hypothetical protein
MKSTENDLGRVGHKRNDPQLIFACYVAHCLKQVPQHGWKKAFKDLTAGRDDIEEIRQLTWEKINNDV